MGARPSSFDHTDFSISDVLDNDYPVQASQDGRKAKKLKAVRVEKGSDFQVSDHSEDNLFQDSDSDSADNNFQNSLDNLETKTNQYSSDQITLSRLDAAETEVDNELEEKAAAAEEAAARKAAEKAAAAEKVLRDEVKAQQREILDEFNDRYAATEIGSTTCKPCILEFEDDRLVRRSIADFHTGLAIKENPQAPICTRDKQGRLVKEFVPASRWWLVHRKHRWHSRVVLAPPGSKLLPLEHEAFNLWQGFAREPKEGDWSRNRDHIYRIICDSKQDLFDWLINWLAALVQSPGRHAWIAPVLVGGQGTGKGHLVDQTLGRLFRSAQYAHLGNADELTGQFSEHLSNKVLVYADESFWGNKTAAESLKRFITEDTLSIHPKHFPRYEEPSNLHIIIASNADRPIPIERDDRRFAVFQVGEAMKNNQKYFRELRDELFSGGLEAMLYELLAYEVDDFPLRQPPVNAAKVRMKLDSLGPMDLFWLEMLQNSNDFSQRVSRNSLHADMVSWFEKHHYSGPYPSKEKLGSYFAMHFKRGGMPGWPKASKTKDETRQNAWEFPSLNDCRKVFKIATGTEPAGF